MPCADYFELRDRALLAHETQIDPDGWWFAIPRDLMQRVWPTEDFQRVLQVNLVGVWHCLRAEIAQMRPQRGEAIVNTSSMLGASPKVQGFTDPQPGSVKGEQDGSERMWFEHEVSLSI